MIENGYRFSTQNVGITTQEPELQVTMQKKVCYTAIKSQKDKIVCRKLKPFSQKNIHRNTLWRQRDSDGPECFPLPSGIMKCDIHFCNSALLCCNKNVLTLKCLVVTKGHADLKTNLPLKLQVCFSTYDLLLSPGIKRLKKPPNFLM